MFVCKVPDLLCAVTHIILMCVACFTVCGGPVVCPFPLGVYLLRVHAAWAVGCVGTGAAPVSPASPAVLCTSSPCLRGAPRVVEGSGRVV